jgi:heat shock protein 1/8
MYQFMFTLTRTCFEELCGDLFRNMLEPLQKILWDSKIDKGSAHKIAIVVGASALIPGIFRLVREDAKCSPSSDYRY